MWDAYHEIFQIISLQSNEIRMPRKWEVMHESAALEITIKQKYIKKSKQKYIKSKY